MVFPEIRRLHILLRVASPTVLLPALTVQFPINLALMRLPLFRRIQASASIWLLIFQRRAFLKANNPRAYEAGCRHSTYWAVGEMAQHAHNGLCIYASSIHEHSGIVEPEKSIVIRCEALHLCVVASTLFQETLSTQRYRSAPPHRPASWCYNHTGTGSRGRYNECSAHWLRRA